MKNQNFAVNAWRQKMITEDSQAEIFPENNSWEKAKSAEVVFSVESDTEKKIYKGSAKLIGTIKKW